MTPIRSHARGTFEIRRRYRGVAPIRRASGTTDPKQFQRLVRMLDTLYDQGRLDILAGIASGAILPMQVWTEFRTGQVAALPGADVLPQLTVRWERWLSEADTGAANVRARRLALVALQRYAAPAATLQDLPAALAAYRAEDRRHARAVNLCRAACLAFVRDVLGKRHPLYEAVANIPPRPVVAQRKPRPWRADQLAPLIKALGDHHGLMAWTMATTGMGPKEYWHDGFTVEDDRVLVHGQKRGGRERIVPRVSFVVPPARSLLAFRRRLALVAPGHAVYDLRRTYANLLVDANIPANRRRAYMGHGAKTMTELYERPDVTTWLVEDGAAIRRVLGEPPAAPLRLVRGA